MVWSNRFFGSYLHEAVFGYQDGLVSAFALILGVSAAVMDSSLIVLVTLIEAFAGATSMALGSYNSLRSELDFAQSHRQKLLIASPLRLALVMFVAFLVGSFIPLLPFLFSFTLFSTLEVVIVFSLLGLFVAGALKAQVTHRVWWHSGFEMTLLGICAAVVALLAGYVIGLLI